MKTLQRRALRRPNQALPQELLTRLKLIKSQEKYRDQVDTLSVAFPHKEDAVIRWYLQHQDMPYLHIIETYDHGNEMLVHVLLPRWRSVLKMEKLYSEWSLESLTPESEVENVLPSRFRDGEGWMMKPASPAQISTLARQLRLPAQAFPKLTAFNVQVLIQSTLIIRHLPVVCRMIAEVEHLGRIPTARKGFRAA
ncbi:hypothetical protein [Coraliomargarita sinensis]|nr:hypothetical protein [Coraliomargarita sinensis]